MMGVKGNKKAVLQGCQLDVVNYRGEADEKEKKKKKEIRERENGNEKLAACGTKDECLSSKTTCTERTADVESRPLRRFANSEPGSLFFLTLSIFPTLPFVLVQSCLLLYYGEHVASQRSRYIKFYPTSCLNPPPCGHKHQQQQPYPPSLSSIQLADHQRIYAYKHSSLIHTATQGQSYTTTTTSSCSCCFYQISPFDRYFWSYT